VRRFGNHAIAPVRLGDAVMRRFGSVQCRALA
jgi:hypothetical protein